MSVPEFLSPPTVVCTSNDYPWYCGARAAPKRRLEFAVMLIGSDDGALGNGERPFEGPNFVPTFNFYANRVFTGDNLIHNLFLAAERNNIGHPKLFIGGVAGRQEAPAAPTVNNFAAPTSAVGAPGFGWPLGCICSIR